MQKLELEMRNERGAILVPLGYARFMTPIGRVLKTTLVLAIYWRVLSYFQPGRQSGPPGTKICQLPLAPDTAMKPIISRFVWYLTSAFAKDPVPSDD